MSTMLPRKLLPHRPLHLSPTSARLIRQWHVPCTLCWFATRQVRSAGMRFRSPQNTACFGLRHRRDGNSTHLQKGIDMWVILSSKMLCKTTTVLGVQRCFPTNHTSPPRISAVQRPPSLVTRRVGSRSASHRRRTSTKSRTFWAQILFLFLRGRN